MRKSVILSMSILMALCSLATAADRLVPNTYPTIQAAIDAAVTGDSVVIGPGTYTGVGNRDISFKGKAITVRSLLGPSSCIIDCQGLGRGFLFETNEKNTSILQGLTIKNGKAVFGGAIECYMAIPSIQNCIISGNTAEYGGGIDCYQANPAIFNCIFEANKAQNANLSGSGGAIELDASSPSVINCLFQSNTSDEYGIAVDCFNVSKPVITNCTFIQNQSPSSTAAAVYADGLSALAKVVSSILWNNKKDILGAGVQYSCVQDGTTGTGVINTDPLFRTGPKGIFYLSQIVAGQLADSPCLNTGDPAANLTTLGINTMSTRTDNVADAARADMGYHYPGGAAAVQVPMTIAILPGANGQKNGTIVPAEGTVSYPQFTELSLKATPNLGYKVEKWTNTDNDASVETTNRVTVTAAKTVSVKFRVHPTFTLTTQIAAGQGTLLPPTGLQNSGDTITLTATPADGYRVGAWTGTDNDEGAFSQTTATVTIDKNKTVTVAFVSSTISHLDVRVLTGHGTVTPRRGDYPVDTKVNLLATPDAGYRVKQWTRTDDDTLKTNANTVTLNFSREVTVEFEKTPRFWLQTETYTYDQQPHGTIDPPSKWVDENIDPANPTKITLTAKPAAGWEVERWLGTDTDYTAPGVLNTALTNEVTMDNDHRVVVQFREIEKDPLKDGNITINGVTTLLYPTIQDAIDAAVDGDEVVVGPGTFQGPGNIDLEPKGKAIVIRSAYGPDKTIINCGGAGRGFYVRNNEGPGTIIRGFTIRNGSAPTGDNVPASGRGGGIMLVADCQAVVENCIIENCQASVVGGGVCFGGADTVPSSPAVGDDPNAPDYIPEDPGVANDAALIPQARLANCTLRNCSSGTIGGGIYIEEAAPQIVSCMIERCSSQDMGAAVYSLGITDQNRHPAIINCLILRNNAGGLGSVTMENSSPTIRLCTLAMNNGGTDPDNPRLGPAGGLVAIGDTSDPTINHCILYNNGDDLRGCRATYSCVSDRDYDSVGQGNIFDDPMFLTGPMGDNYLSQTMGNQPVESACVDAGQMILFQLQGQYGVATDITTSVTDTDDTGRTDLGYHYPKTPVTEIPVRWKFKLYPAELGSIWFQTEDNANRVPQEEGTLTTDSDPVVRYLPDWTLIHLKAIGLPGYRLSQWTGTDDDQTTASGNLVTLTSDREVQVLFEETISRILVVPAIYATIEDAISVAKDSDIVVVSPGIHYISNPTGIDFGGKQIKLISTDPANPATVAATIIDCQGIDQAPKRAFYFHNSETRDTLVAGFTIRKGWWNGGVGGLAPGYIWPGNPPDYAPNLTAPDPLIGSLDSGGDWTGDGYGGAVLCEKASSPTFQYCVFTQNVVTGGQGLDGLNGFTIYDDQRRGHSQPGSHGGTGTGNGYGGAIACREGSNPLLGFCTFIGNYARGGCGGDGGNAGPLSQVNPGNESRGGNGGDGYGVGCGGAIYADGASGPLVMECAFDGNAAAEGLPGIGGNMTSGSSWGSGGGVDWVAADGTTGLVQAIGGTISGGAVYFGDQSVADFSYCRFIGNKAFEAVESGMWTNRADPPTIESYINTYAGAMYIGQGDIVNVRDTIFEGNLGGAIYFEGNDAIQLQRCSFRANGSALPGVQNTVNPQQPALYQGPAGALSINTGCSVTISDCEFAANFTFSNGGAAYVYSSALFERCRFGGNVANGYGGAIYSDSRTLNPGSDIPILTLNQSDFYENEAIEGGAFYLYVTQANLNGCNIFSNLSQKGGGLLLGQTWVNLAGGTIAGNSAESFEAQGGGIACVDTTLNLSDCILQANRVDGSDTYGGALSIYGSDVRARQTIQNCLFAGNTAANSGGAMSARVFSFPNISNCTFSGNKAEKGGGIFGDWTSKPSIINSILTGNNPQAIYEQPIGYDALPGGDSVVAFSLFYSNTADLFDGQTKQSYTGAAAINTVGSNHDNLDGNPLFATGILGAFYLNTASPAVNRGDRTAELAGLASRTTRVDSVFDTGQVDLGYHYVGMTGVPTVTLSVSVVGGHGQVTPVSGTYYQGQTVVLTATPDFGYRVDQWGGGTINDLSDNTINVVVMTDNKAVTVQFEQPRVLVVGSTGPYTQIQRAIDDAKDGDSVLIQPGRYEERTQGGTYSFDILYITGKTIKLSGLNPSNPQTVADTVLVGYYLSLSGVGKDSIIQGLTFTSSHLSLVQSKTAIRNCNFIDCNFGSDDGDPGDTDGPSDGENGYAATGAAIDMYNSSPIILNCRFENCSEIGGNGGLGSNGNDPGHRTGYDGGWAGPAYGGAIYMGFNSNPKLVDCEFINCFVQGGNGGNGGNGVDPARDYGGRGGSWVWSKTHEEDVFYWWDGWDWGNRYSGYFDATYVAMGEVPAYLYNYPWDQYAKWFGLEQYNDWTEWLTKYRYDPFETAYDEYWRYSGYGGAVYCEFGCEPTFVNCRFENNHSFGGVSGMGGTGLNDIPWPDRTLNLETGGGAVFATRGCKVAFVDCLFRGNQADPATDALNDDPYVSFGGGIAYTTESIVKAVNCTFVDNQAAIGGAIYWNESDLEIADCNLVSNSAYQGAALYSAYSTGLIRGSTVTDNLAMYNPSTVFVQFPGQTSPIPDLPNVITSGNGGGYFSLSTPAIIENSVFQRNQASGSGGGLFAIGSDEDIFAAPTLSNCLITDNIAQVGGGGVAGAWYAEPALLNCTIADNTVTDPNGQGGGMYVGYFSNGTITNSIVWNNVARYGSQVAVSSGGKYSEMPSSMEISYSDILYHADASQLLPPITTQKAIRSGFDTYSLPANINQSSDLIYIGFPIEFFGRVYDTLYVNNNGNVTFDRPLAGFNPLALTGNLGNAIIAPFFANVDTRNPLSDIVTWAYGPGRVDGHDAFAVNWVDVGYAINNGDKLNAFQLVIIDRSDRSPGDFDMEFNYGKIQWETGDLDGGIDGLGGESARVGYSNGSGNPGTYYELEGSGVNGSFLDSSTTGLIYGRRNSRVLGRYLFSVINGRTEIPGSALYVEKDSELYGWDELTQTWQENLKNFNSNPLFVGGYYLSQIAAGQKKTSPAVDAGSDKASVFGLIEPYATRSDGVSEAPDSIVDLGYHYRKSAALSRMALKLIHGEWGTISYTPASGIYEASTSSYLFPIGTVVHLTAVPNAGYRVRRWAGSDDERSYVWNSNSVEVTMDQSRTVELEFEKDISRVLLVPEVYPTIEEAVNVSSDGDTIVIGPGIHYIQAPEGIDFGGRNLRLISTDPDDPQIIAGTIIDCQGTRYGRKRAFHFHNGEGSETVISGLTIQNGLWTGAVGMSGVRFVDPTSPLFNAARDAWPYLDPPNNNFEVYRAPYGLDARGTAYAGAILLENGSSPTFDHCVIQNCSVIGAWAGDGANGGTLTSTRHSQPGGHGGIAVGNGFGGAIACLEGSSPIVRNCTFKNNMARGAVGGIGGNAGQTTSGNENVGGDGGDARGYSQGGAIYSDRQSSPLVEDCSFTGNVAAGPMAGAGGNMASGSSWGNVNGINWVATNGTPGTGNGYNRVGGGALAYGLNSNAKVIRTSFTENRAYEGLIFLTTYTYRTELNQSVSYANSKGGAIFSDPNNLIDLEDCSFVGNLGGGVYLHSKCDVDIRNCSFMSNECSGQPDMPSDYFNAGLYEYYIGTPPVILSDTTSGALYIGPGSRGVVVENCEFYKNYTFGDGGAVTCKSDAKFDNCRFGENRADRYGGGFFAYDADRDPNLAPEPVIELTECSFLDNASWQGGGLWLRETIMGLKSTSFFTNTSDIGGGILSAESDLVLDTGIFHGNQSTGKNGHGGAIALAATNGVIKNATFEKNLALGDNAYGGAVSFYGSDSRASQLIENCLLTENQATMGAAIACRINTDATISNCTFSGNQASMFGGAVFADWSSSPKITDSIVVGNTPEAVYEEQIGGNSQIVYSLFNANPKDLFDAQTGTTYTGAAALNTVGSNTKNRDGDPKFVAGTLGAYYLALGSPAIDAGSRPAVAAGLNLRTTRKDNLADSGIVDLGYHYVNATTLPKYHLTTQVEGGHGRVEPTSGDYYAGTPVVLTAFPDQGYSVQSWTGGTANDQTRENDNLVFMNSNKSITVRFYQPRILLVGSGTELTSIQHAIELAEDGDIILVKAGQYIPASPYGVINFMGKTITLSGMNPDDPASVAATVLQGYNFYLFNIGNKSVIEGFTIRGGGMWLVNSQLTIRNCAFENTTWIGVNGLDGPSCDQGPRDGTNGSSVYGGALEMYHSSPKIQNCRFEGLELRGGTGGRGSDGCPSHTEGWDGGWAGRAYGAAAYIGFNSNPIFEKCVFRNCSVVGGNGGNGGNGIGGDKGGRGGNWIWSDVIEDTQFFWWDGWEFGDKYTGYQWVGLERNYDWNRWSYWYDLGAYFDWNDWARYYAYDPYKNAYEEYWRYSGYGGAVYCDFDSKATFTTCHFESNRTFGGVSGIGGTLGPIDPSRNLNIENGGGALFATRGSKIDLVGCLFRGNSSDSSTLNNADPAVDTYDDYYVSFGGGVAATQESVVRITDCSFESNQAAIGGGLYWGDSEAEVADCNFIANSAYHGGGLYSADSEGSLVGLYASLNLASVDPSILASQTDPAFAAGRSPIILPNLPHMVAFGEGGAYFCLSSDVNIRDSVFKKNRAAGSGGGIYYVGSNPDVTISTLLHNSVFSDNVAGRDGGGVSVDWYSRVKITNSTLAENTVTGSAGQGAGYGGGLSVSYGSDADVLNSIIWDNVAVEGAQLAVGSGNEFGPRPSTVRVHYTDIGPEYDPNAILDITDEGSIIPMPPQGNGTAVVTDLATLQEQFTGGGMAKIIVLLQQPIELRRALDWSNPFTVQAYRAEINQRITAALSTLPAGEFVLKYRYENIAAFSGSVTQAGLDQLINSPMVASIEPVRTVQPMLRQAIPLANALQARQEFDGTGIAIAIVDSGVDYRHTMLGGGGFPNSKVIGGYDFGMNDADPIPVVNAHGTCCAGIAAGSLGDVGDYIGGVAYNAKLYALKHSDDAGAILNNASLAAWDWCITHQNDNPDNPILVMSNSWGIPNYPFNNRAAADAFAPAYTQMAALAVERGITIMVASGNDGFAGQGISWPAAMSNVISVGAVYDTTDLVTVYSDTAEILDILAPADPVYTTDIVGTAGYDPGDYFPTFAGTSSACPFAAGCVADIQNAARVNLSRYLLPEEVRRLLIRTGDPVTDTKVAITKPRVNLGMAIAGMTPPKPIYVEDGVTLEGWDDASQTWAADTFNLMVDPEFVGIGEYFLSEITAGQLQDSPCVNAGSDLASAFGLDTYTTRSDSVFDAGKVNLGYHRRQFIPEFYLLRTTVYPSGLDSLYGYNPTITPYDPEGIEVKQFTQFELKIQPTPPVGYDVRWTGTDNDRIVLPRNVVTVDRNKAVMAEFVKVSFELTTKVTVDPDLLPGFSATITPASGLIKPMERVKLTVTTPPAGFQVRWKGTDKDGIVAPINYVTMKRDTKVEAWYEKIETKYYAIIGGINDIGGGYPVLKYAEADASLLYSKLTQMPEWKTENIHLLLGANATMDRMREAILDLRQRMDPDDVFLFYFAGQGFASADMIPLDEFDGFDENLILAGQVALSDDQMAKWIGSLPTHKYAVFLDTGYHSVAGSPELGFTPRGLGLNVPKPGDDFGIDLIPHQSLLPDGTAYLADPNGLGVVVSASQGDQVAWENSDLGHGLFTYFLLKAIDGWADQNGNKNGWTSGEECFTYISTNLAAWLKDWDEISALPAEVKQQPSIYDAIKTQAIEFVSTPSTGAEPRTFYIPGSADSIQPVIDVARDGDLIVLAANIYRGGLVIDKNITITSANPDDPEVVAATIIDCSTTVNRGVYFTRNAGPGAVLNGVTVRNGVWTALGPDAGVYDGRSISGGGILVGFQSSPTIKNCVISGFRLTGGNAVAGPGPDGDDGGFAMGAGIYCSEESAPSIINTTITDCHVTGGNATNGVSASPGNPTANPPVPASPVSGRGGWGGGARGGGVYIAPKSKPEFRNCTIDNCTATGGNGGNGGNYGQINGVDVPGSYGGLWSDNSSAPWQAWGYVGDYRYYAGSGAGIYCEIESEPKFVECLISGNQTRGGMSGQGGTMPSGQDRRQPTTPYELPSYGGGIFCGEKVKAEFVKCRFYDNVAPKPATNFTLNSSLGHGGGIAFERSTSIIFDACSFRRNNASVGAGMYYLEDSPVIADCNFIANDAYQGGGLFADGGAGTIDNTEFIANLAGSITTPQTNLLGQGGGLASVTSAIRVRNSQFVSNYASTSGGGLFFSGVTDGTTASPSMTNILIAQNVAGRDGGGVSANWSTRLKMSNCTVASNETTGRFGQTLGDGLGGGLYAAYESQVEVIDSIFWANAAASGSQLVVGTGFEFDPRPGKVTVSYSDIPGGWSEPFVVVEDGSTLVQGPGNLVSGSLNPLFVRGPFGNYYLSQLAATQTEQSPCVDKGSASASSLGMNLFTTRNDRGPNNYDSGKVDMGFHYPLTRTVAACQACDLPSNGRNGVINLPDFAILAHQWLGNCVYPEWCQGSDINRDGHVDLTDLLSLTSCWMTVDRLAPRPNPAEWGLRRETITINGQPFVVYRDGRPAPGANSTEIIMTAARATDDWGWEVAYQFECVKIGNQVASVKSPWLYYPTGVDPTWTATGLVPETTYTYVVRVAEIRVPGTLAEAGIPVNPTGSTALDLAHVKYVSRAQPYNSNWTADSLPASTTTGLESDPPAPIAWEVQPYQNATASVTMTAAAATDVHLPVSYIFLRYRNATDQIAESAFGPVLTRTWVDTNVLLGETWTYTFVAVDNLGNTSAPAPRVTVTIAVVDTTPPLPDPLTWQIEPVRQFVNGSWYDFMQTSVAVDPEATVVEYQVRETQNGTLTTWRTEAPTYVGPDGNAYPGNTFWIPAGGQFTVRSYQCRARDSSANQNTTAWSTPVAYP